MDEFVNTTRQQAAQMLRTMFLQEPEGTTDPVLELISLTLEDGAGGLVSAPDVPVTTEQWLTWNRLTLNQGAAVTRMVTRELEQERTPLPMEPEALRPWAASLLLATLDRLGMK